MVNLYVFNEVSRAAIFGIGTYIRELTDALKDCDINVCMVHIRSEKPDSKPDVHDGIRHIYIPPPTNRSTSLDWRSSELYYRNVVYFLRLQIKDTERLIFHFNYYKTRILAEELKKAFLCKNIAVVHYSEWGSVIFDNQQRLQTVFQDETPDDFNMNLKIAVEEEKLSYSKMDRIICLSNYMFDILCRDYKFDAAKISVIPNSLTDRTKTNNLKKLLRKKWKIADREKIILFAGRIDTIKGIEYLLKAFREVLYRFPRSRLIIAGDGAFNKYTKESQDICTKITYTGLLDKAQLYEWYSLADVGVTPSLFEQFGYVAVEMMMHELPIVATATSGLNEVVDETCGLKVPLVQTKDNVEIDTGLLAEKIVYLLEHPDYAKRLGVNARKRYEQLYSIEVFRKNMMDFYQSLYE